MIIENKDALFFGCTESLLEVIERLTEILKTNNDEHTVLMCLSVMSAMARLDFAEIQAMIEDIPGLDDLVGFSVYECAARSADYLIATKKGI